MPRAVARFAKSMPLSSFEMPQRMIALRLFELAEQGVLMTSCHAWDDDVDAHRQVLSTGPSECEEDHNRESCNSPTALYPCIRFLQIGANIPETEARVTPVKHGQTSRSFVLSAIEDELTLGRFELGDLAIFSK